MAQEGVEPSASLVLSESGLPVAYRAGRGLNPGATTQGGIRTHRRPGLSRAAQPLAYLGSPLRGGSRGTRTHERPEAATCFQDRPLIRPDGFRVRSDRSSGGWTRTSGLRVQSAASLPPATAPEFGKEDSNPHRLIQSQGAYRLADSRVESAPRESNPPVGPGKPAPDRSARDA